MASVNAQAIDSILDGKSATPGPHVRVGTTVEVRYLADGETFVVSIAQERDRKRGAISTDSPLACALLGARTGETRVVTVGKDTYTVQVLEIR